MSPVQVLVIGLLLVYALRTGFLAKLLGAAKSSTK